MLEVSVILLFPVPILVSMIGVVAGGNLLGDCMTFPAEQFPLSNKCVTLPATPSVLGGHLISLLCNHPLSYVSGVRFSFARAKRFQIVYII